MTQKTINHTPGHKLNEDILKLCHKMELPLHYNHRGPKEFTNYQRVGLIVLFHRSRKALRDFVKELCESLWPRWLGLRRIPGKSTLHDWLKMFNVPNVRKFNELLIEKEQPSLLAIDGTGIDSWQRSRHYQRRIGDPYMPYAKLDSLVDTQTGIIFDHCLRVKPRHDVLGATSILRRTKLRNVIILGDKGYDSEPLHEIAAEKQIRFFAPVRKSSRKTPKGRYRKTCVEKIPEYPRRNVVESAFHALKAVHVNALRSKKHFMKKREMAWHVLVYNMKRINKTIASWLVAIYELFPDTPVINTFFQPASKPTTVP